MTLVLPKPLISIIVRGESISFLVDTDATHSMVTKPTAPKSNQDCCWSFWTSSILFATLGSTCWKKKIDT